MPIKQDISKFAFKYIENGTISAEKAFGPLSYIDRFLSLKMSKGGRYLRKNQIDFIKKCLNKNNRRGWLSVFFPTELLYPLHIYPLSLEVLSGILATCGVGKGFLERSLSIGAPNSMCSFHRTLLGIADSKYFTPPDFVASTSAFCDGNLHSFKESSKIAKVPFFYLDIPFEYNEKSAKYLKDELVVVAENIAGVYGEKFDLVKFKRSIQTANESLKLLKEIYKARMDCPTLAFRGFEMVNFCFPSHYLMGSEVLSDVSRHILASMKNDDRHSYYKGLKEVSPKRLMWMHIVPQYDTPMWEILDNGRTAKIVCEEYTKPYFEGYDMNDPFGSIAKRLITHPSNGPVEKRIENALQIAKDFKVDGVVHYSSWGCHQASGVVSQIELEFERAGFRFININGDAVDADNTTFGQHKTRLEAFLEHL